VTFDVDLPKSDAPAFPAACVRCGETPTTHVKIREDAVGWWSVIRFGWVFSILSGKGYDVPACERCAGALRGARWKRKAAEAFFIAVGIAVGMWMFPDLEGFARTAALVILAVLVALPWFVFDLMYPETVTITVWPSKVTFHFADEAYAQDFADRNPTL
jgi:hypothetical protein